MDGKAKMRRLGKEKVRRGENQSSVFFFFPDAPSMQVKTPDSWQQLQRKEG